MKSKVFFDLLLYRTFANLQTEVARYYLNYLWWLIDPILSMAVYFLVFGVLLQRGTEHFVAFLFCGVTAWRWFSATASKAGLTISSNKLMYQVDIPKVFFPIELLLTDAFKHIFVMSVLLVFLMFYPTPVSATWCALPVLLVIQFIFNAAIAMLCAALVPFVPDLQFIINTMLHLAFFGSGIFYSLEQVVSPELQSILYLNPMAGLIHNYRLILMYATWPDWQYLFYLGLASLMLLGFGVWLIFKLDYLYPKVCQE